MFRVSNVSKSFGGQILFDDISFIVNDGEKVGFVGRNGHGKTTLFRMLIGEDHPDDGEISFPKNYSIGYVKQHIGFTENTLLKECVLGLPDYKKEEVWQAEKILFGLGFSRDDMHEPPEKFSGGYQVRLNLAKVLISEPDLLLLDEPTNYLDIISIRWLSDFLRKWTSEFVLITHDRSFMDSVVTDVIGIHRLKTKKIKGRTEKLYNQILKEEEIYEKTRVNDEKKRKEVELFITRFRAKARLAGMVQSRIKALDKQERLEGLEKISSLDFSFTYMESQAKVLLSADNLSFAYQKDTPIIRDLSFSIGKHDRICIIGKNGKGKTTLLKLLAGELKLDSGEIMVHNATNSGYFAQTNTINLNQSLTIEEEIMNSGCERQIARNICGAMMFEGDMALKKIKVLSGGEKSRVLLGKMLASPSNLLLLDEPTNHLDMESCDTFIAAIDSFPGAAVMVTHNEMFLHSLANRFIVFQKEKVILFEGSYQSFLDRVGWEEEEDLFEKNDFSLKENRVDSKNKKDVRKMKADILNRKTKIVKPIEKKIGDIENFIEGNEKELNSLNEKMIDAVSSGKGKDIEDISKMIHVMQKKIDGQYEIFESLSTELDKHLENFNVELDKLNSNYEQII